MLHRSQIVLRFLSQVSPPKDLDENVIQAIETNLKEYLATGNVDFYEVAFRLRLALLTKPKTQGD